MRDMFISIGRYANRYRSVLLVLMLGLCLESVYDVVLRYSLKFVIDAAVVQADMKALLLILGALAIGALLFNFVVIGCDYIWAKMGGRILNDIRYDMFCNLQRLPVSYYRRNATGDLTARFNADLAQIESGMVLALPMAVMGLVEVVMTLVIMGFLHPLLFLVATFGIVMSLLVPRFIQGRALHAAFDLRREEGRMVGHLQENLTAQAVVKAYSLEGYASNVFRQRLDELLVKLARSNFLSYLVSRLPSLVFLFMQLLVLAVGGWLAINKQITVGDLVAYQALLIGLNYAIHNLTWTIPSFIDASAGWQRVKEILDEPITIADKPNAVTLPRLSKEIEFSKVVFSYPDAESPAIGGVDLRIGAGEYVTFVGRSGAGKSSIMNLLMRFFEVGDGSVKIDNLDVRDVTLASLRGQIGLVSQEVMLFDISVRDNIRLGKLDATDMEIETAARAAEIHDFIETLPEGYGTNAGTAGARFSGGERQRIALARALVRKPAILMLDEFSSALDPTTEAAILKTIARLKGTCTIIGVTHRLAMAEDADRVVVLRGGRIVESGPHSVLIARRTSEYFRLWRRGGEHPARADAATPAAETKAVDKARVPVEEQRQMAAVGSSQAVDPQSARLEEVGALPAQRINEKEKQE
jgi:ATP-binding cassette subfamily B protein